jgi:antitoxin component YwqK of YwqJK toxin-antitoxin module
MESGFKLKNNLPTGQYNVYNNDTLIYIAMYNENKKNGKWYYFYGDGDTNSIINYLDGLENGYYKRFYKGSKLMQLGYYKNGIMDGDWCFYSESGEKISVTTWENDFKVKSIGYYASGKIQSIENFSKGLFHGRCEYFFEDGSIDRVIYYNQDKVIDFKRYEKGN